MLYNFTKFIFILLYSIIILEVPAVWSSDLEKIQRIENRTSLKDIFGPLGVRLALKK